MAIASAGDIPRHQLDGTKHYKSDIYKNWAEVSYPPPPHSDARLWQSSTASRPTALKRPLHRPLALNHRGTSRPTKTYFGHRLGNSMPTKSTYRRCLRTFFSLNNWKHLCKYAHQRKSNKATIKPTRSGKSTFSQHFFAEFLGTLATLRPTRNLKEATFGPYCANAKGHSANNALQAWFLKPSLISSTSNFLLSAFLGICTS